MLKPQYFGHLMQKFDSLKKTLMLGKTEGKRRGRQRLKELDGIIGSMDMVLSKHWETVKDREAGHATVHGLQRAERDLATDNKNDSDLATDNKNDSNNK